VTHLLNALAQATGVSLAEAARRTATLTGTGIDILDYEGVALVVLNTSAGSGTSPTLDVKLQHSDDNTAFLDVNAGTFSQITSQAETAGLKVMKVNAPDLKRYLRVVGTLAGTSPSFDYSVEFIGIKKVS
jgi:hypothetical protein